jgi:hypothetical protein
MKPLQFGELQKHSCPLFFDMPLTYFQFNSSPGSILFNAKKHTVESEFEPHATLIGRRFGEQL